MNSLAYVYGQILTDEMTISRMSPEAIRDAITELSRFLTSDEIALVKIGEGELAWNPEEPS